VSVVKEMPLPPAAKEPAKAQEILRVWIIGDQHAMHVSIDVAAFNDSRAWGVVLADLARHIANSYERMAVAPAPKVLNSIAAQFVMEVDKPTSVVTNPQDKAVQ